MRKFVLVWICTILLFGGVVANAPLIEKINSKSNVENVPAYTPHDPIMIMDDFDFEIQGFPGVGTKINPYIIENYDINGSVFGYCIWITGTTVYFTIRNCYLHNAFPTGGIFLNFAPNGIIFNNTITDNERGITLGDAQNNIVNNNTITNSTTFGIGLDLNCNNNVLQYNFIENNSMDGISFWWATGNIEVKNNKICNSQQGIDIGNSDGITFCNNSIILNQYGIRIDSSNNNEFFHNNMISNVVQVETYEFLVNIWDNGYPSGGNYWSDYSGVDLYHGTNQDMLGSDGVGDTPYIIPYGPPDNYPLMVPFNYTENVIQLQEGWNLISIPVRQFNNSIGATLENIVGKWDCIQTYDSIDSNWKSNNINRPDSLNDLTSMNHLGAYWINITEPGVTLTVKGDKFGSALSIPLCAGWNLVGYPTLNDTMTVANALWGTGADRVEKFDALAPYRISEVGPTYIMKPGEGYWVHVPADTVWVVDW